MNYDWYYTQGIIPKVNLGIGKMGFMFCDLFISLKYPFAGGYKFDEFALLDFCFVRDSRNFSFGFTLFLGLSVFQHVSFFGVGDIWVYM